MLKIGEVLLCTQSIYGFCISNQKYSITDIILNPNGMSNYDDIYIKGIPIEPKWIKRYQITQYFKIKPIQTILPLP